MALRLRRGTDAERLTITPVESELIYTTDTKELWIGDGVTVGGNKISGEISLNDLIDVDLSTPPTVGQVLVWNGTRFVPDNVENTGGGVSSIFDLNDVFSITPPDAGDVLIFDGSNFVPRKIQVIEGADSTIILNTATNTFTGNFVGDGSGLTNLPGGSITGSIFDLNDVFAQDGFSPDAGDVLIFDGANFISQKIQVIEGADSTIILDTATNTFTGNFVGDGSGLINLPIDNDTYNISVRGNDNTVLIDRNNNTLDGTFVGLTNGTVQANVLGFDSSIIVDSDNNRMFASFIGDLTGNVTGDVKGSVFSDDSVLMVDAVNNTLTAGSLDTNIINSFATDLNLNISGNLNYNRNNLPVFIINNNQPNVDLHTTDALHGVIIFRTTDVAGTNSSAIIGSSNTGITISKTDSSFALPDSHKIFIGTNGNFGFGTITPDVKFDFQGNAKFNGFVQFGSLTTTERNSLTAANGMVIYNTTNNKFEGYQNGAWINLDDGNAAS
jgi:hypothetical protein